MKIQVKMALLACVLVLTLSGTVSAADTSNTSIYSDNSSLNSDQSPAVNTTYPDPIISGVVMDNSTHMGMANVSVKVKDQNNNLVAETLTNADGTYSVGFISPNTVFNVMASKYGYITLAKEITVNLGPNPGDSNLYGTVNFQLIPIPYNGSASSTLINIGALANILLELNVGKTSAWVDTQNIPYSEGLGTPLEVKLLTGNLLEGLLNVDSVGGQGYVTGGISTLNLPVLLKLLGINAGLLEANANSTVDPSQATGSSSLASVNLSPLLLHILNLGLINSNSSVIPDFNNGALTSSANCGTVQDISLLNGLLVIRALNINATASANGTPGGAYAKFDWNAADIELAGMSILNNLTLNGVVEIPGVLRISLGTENEITSPDGTYAKASGSALSVDLLDIIPGSLLTLNIGEVMAEASVPLGGLNPTTNDLSVTKTVDKIVANYEELLNYTITAHNNGPDNATNVLVHDILPTGVTWISDDSNGAYNPTTGTWTIPNLPNGTNTVLHILTQITTSNTTITNAASIENDAYDPNTDNNQANVTTTVNAASDLVVTKTVDKSTANYHEQVNYTITAHNNGPDNATGVTVTEKLPEGLTWISDDSNGAYDPTTGTWTIPNLPNGTNTVLHILTQITTSNTTITNLVNINNNTYDQNNTNNQANTTVNVGPTADLSITKTVDNTNPNYLQNVIYTLTAHNNGPDNATNVLVHDILPTGITWISDDSNGAYNPTTGTWTIPNLPNGTNTVLHILTQITTSNTTITNLVNINNNTYDQNNTNNQANTTVNVGPTADLSITKTVDNTNPNYLQNVIYTLTAHNNGPDNATGVTVTEKLPNGLRYVSDDSKGNYNPTTGTWTIGTLKNGVSAILHITAQTISANTQIINTATINNNTYDQNNTNNQANTTVNVGPASDLGINITVDKAQPQYLDYVTFTLTAHNYGPEAAPYVKVYNTLPNGLKYVSNDSNGSFNPTTGLWTVGYMANGASAILHITAQAMISNAQLTDNATITDPDPVTLTGFYDPNPSNNQASVTVEPYSKCTPTNPGKSVNTRTNTKVGEETTVPMLPTGAPINIVIMAILITIAGTIYPKIKG